MAAISVLAEENEPTRYWAIGEALSCGARPAVRYHMLDAPPLRRLAEVVPAPLFSP